MYCIRGSFYLLPFTSNSKYHFQSFCLTRYGATPGKRLLRLRVLKCDNLQIQENGEVTIEPRTILNSGA
jgi:uncharacterized RDD family membrane protein YckC